MRFRSGREQDNQLPLYAELLTNVGVEPLVAHDGLFGLHSCPYYDMLEIEELLGLVSFDP